MLINKSKAISAGKAYVSFDGKIEKVFSTKYDFTKKIVTEFPKHFGREMLFAIVHKSIQISERAKVHLYAKIGHIIEAVKGKHFPKSGKESSFFLGHIEKNKETVSADL